MKKYFLILIALFVFSFAFPRLSLAVCDGGAYVVVGRQSCEYTASGLAYVGGTANEEWQDCRVVLGYGCVRPDTYGKFCTTEGAYTCGCVDINSANNYYYTSNGCYDSPSGGGGGNPPPPPVDTPTPTPTPTPLPANFNVTNLYLTDQAGGKHYNFPENTNIFWHADVLNNGASTATTANGRVYMNLYENREADVTTFTSNHTNTYIDTDDSWLANTSRGFSSADGGNRMNEFTGPEGRAFKRVGSETNGGEPLFARIMVDNDNAQHEAPGSELTDNQMYYRYVIGDPNLEVSSFTLTNNAGANSTAFDIGENIFPKVTISNIGDARAISKDPNDQHTYTWFYSNEPTDVATNTVGDTGVRLMNGEFSANTSFEYYCRPTPGLRCNRYPDQLAWDKPAKGVYTARVFLNFDHGVVETRYADNQATVEYSVGYTIKGRIYADMNKSGGFTTGVDFPLDNVTVTFTGPTDSGTATTGSDGKYTSPALEPGIYSITTNVSSDYTTISTYPQSSNFSSRADLTGQDIRYFPKYSITGNVFVDSDDSRAKDGAEINYAATPGITISSIPAGAPTPPAVTNNVEGSYTVTGLISGTYVIQYPNLPDGYVMTHPVNTVPPTFSAPVGSGCNQATPNPGGSCNAGNLQDVNFGIKAGQPWFQALGLDARMDSGFYDPVPPSPMAACGGAYAMLPGSSTTPGVVFTGSTPVNTWQGAVSSTNWVVGGSAYPETSSQGNAAKTSYGYLLSIAQTSGITLTKLSTKCTLTDCTLPASLPTGAIYTTDDGNGATDDSLTLNSFTVPASKNFVILVNGDLTIKGTIRVPTTSTILFSTSGNITVDPSVGSTAACPPPLAGLGDLEGFYSADKSFIAQSGSSLTPKTADCAASPTIPDKQLNVQGAIVVNAGNTSGQFSNQRDLCTGNTDYPSLTIKERPDMILHAPDFLRVPSYIWQEVAP